MVLAGCLFISIENCFKWTTDTFSNDFGQVSLYMDLVCRLRRWVGLYTRIYSLYVLVCDIHLFLAQKTSTKMGFF